MAEQKTTYTPGPWLMWGDRQWIDKDSRRYPEWRSVVRVASGPNVGQQICSMARLDSEGEANAHLIAAAPELFEALKLAAEHMASHLRTSKIVNVENPGLEKSLSIVRAAIAKAEGR